MLTRIFSRLADWFTAGSPRQQQKTRDTIRLALAMHFRRELVAACSKAGVPVDVTNSEYKLLQNEIATSFASSDLQRTGRVSDEELQRLATEQLLGMFSVAAFGPNPPTDVRFARQHQMAVPFSLRLDRSTVQHADAGQGVFLNGYVPPGTVVAIYPGIVYAPIHWPKMPNYPQIDKDNSYLMIRYDDFCLDGKGYETAAPAGVYAQQAARLARLRRGDFDLHGNFVDRASIDEFVPHLGGRHEPSRVPYHPYALAHLVNHPARGGAPNVLKLSYDFPVDFPELFQQLIPNRYFFNPPLFAGGHVPTAMRTIVFVATDHIHNAELFLNYRYNPNMKNMPDWYSHVDRDEAERLWARQ